METVYFFLVMRSPGTTHTCEGSAVYNPLRSFSFVMSVKFRSALKILPIVVESKQH
jgi:hypothetical protein